MNNVEKFVKAVRENEYEQLEIYPKVHLITDMDSEPYIVTEREFEMPEVSDMLHDLHFCTFLYIEYDERNSEQMNQNVWHIGQFKLTEKQE